MLINKTYFEYANTKLNYSYYHCCDPAHCLPQFYQSRTSYLLAIFHSINNNLGSYFKHIAYVSILKFIFACDSV